MDSIGAGDEAAPELGELPDPELALEEPDPDPPRRPEPEGDAIDLGTMPRPPSRIQCGFNQ